MFSLLNLVFQKSLGNQDFLVLLYIVLLLSVFILFAGGVLSLIIYFAPIIAAL